MGRSSTTTGEPKACPVTPHLLSLKIAKGLCGLRPHRASKAFAIPRITTFSASEGLGKDAAIGVLAGRDGTVWVANSGSLDYIANGRVSSIRTGEGLPGSQVTSLLEDRAGNMWVGVDDGLYLFEKGRFRRLPEPDHRPLGLVVGISEDIDGNVWAACAGKSNSRDVRSHSRFLLKPSGKTLLRTRTVAELLRKPCWPERTTRLQFLRQLRSTLSTHLL